MRLWHYELIPYLPNSQLISQWRELNCIFKYQTKHILINYVYDYEKNELLKYTYKVIDEMNKRNIKWRFTNLMQKYLFENNLPIKIPDFSGKIFKDHHNERYFVQCFYNLQEKYDRGQRDFTKEVYDKLLKFWFKKIESR